MLDPNNAMATIIEKIVPGEHGVQFEQTDT